MGVGRKCAYEEAAKSPPLSDSASCRNKGGASRVLKRGWRKAGRLRAATLVVTPRGAARGAASAAGRAQPPLARAGRRAGRRVGAA